MALTAGARLGAYEIVAPIGAGGMGEVYRAKDTKLKREVALKVLPDVFANNPDRMARFQREAEVLAALNHPNIAAIYGIEERALVMELVEGKMLAGPLPIETALNYASQIAAALEAAHEKGIIHRDLKPANIKITAAGVVKVLDFGLAAVTQTSAAAVGHATNSPTLTTPTRAGMIMGTAGYMSPEQSCGIEVDKRSDIWAFGVVLYEMLTGRTLFAGKTVSEKLAAVLKDEPNLEKAPAQFRRLLSSCLEKDPKRRLRDIGDMGRLLEGEPQAAPRRLSSTIPWVVAAAATLIAVALGFLTFRPTSNEARVLKSPVPPPEKATFTTASVPAVSPDGRRLAFVATSDGKTKLWVRELDSFAARSLPGTEGANDPFWSPNSQTIAFFADLKLKKIDAAGGPVLSLCDAAINRGGSWSKNGIIVFAPDTRSGLSRVSASGGSVTAVTKLDADAGEISHRYPWFLPDSRHFLYTGLAGANTAIYVGDLDSKGDLKERRRVVAARSNAAYATPGYLLFVREGSLMAQRFDAGTNTASGEPVPIVEQVDFVATNAQGQFSSSQNGILAYASGGGEVAQLTWFDRTGRITGVVGTPGILQWPAISPDGATVAFTRQDPQTGLFNLWLHDLARNTPSRFTFSSGSNAYSVWSPDGQHIAFHSTRDGAPNLYQKQTGGAAKDESLDLTAHTKWHLDWSRDGRYIIDQVTDPKTKFDVWVLPVTSDTPGEDKPFPYLQTRFNELYAKLSPNGEWLAYSSDESKRYEIYVQTFPAPGGKWQVSTNGGSLPIWSRDGKELFFIGADQKLMAVSVKDGDKFQASLPQPLFDTHLGVGFTWFDVSNDGRFLIPTQLEQTASVPLNVVINWTAQLKK